VAVGVAGAAQAMLEGHRHQPPSRLVPVGAVVVAADPDTVALQILNAGLEGLGPALGQQPPDPWAAASGQQRHALGRGKAVVEGLHPRIDPLALVLPGAGEGFAVQLARVSAQDLATEPLDRLDLDPPGAAQLAGRLYRPHIPLERLGPGQRLQLRHALLGGPGLERGQQWPGGQLGPRVSPPERRASLLAGGRVQALEHRLHLLGRGDPLQAAGLGGAADEPAW